MSEQLNALMDAREAHASKVLPTLRRLDNYWWDGQDTVPSHRDVVAKWLEDWYKYLRDESDKPKPILHLFGDNNTGKSHFAIGIARFMVLNYFSLSGMGLICDAKRVRWVNYCKSLFNENSNGIDEEVNVLIIDDIDSFRPVPKSLSTYALEEAVNVIKGRVEDAVLPTIITGNWAPQQLEKFFSSNSMGDSSPATQQAAATLWSVIERNTFAQLRFRHHRGIHDTFALREKAMQENDMSVFRMILPEARF